jgi:hypothetical protein
MTEDAKREGESLRIEIGTAIKEERWGDLTPFAGRSAGLIREILPAGKIVRRIAAEALFPAVQKATSLPGGYLPLFRLQRYH